MTLGWPMAFLVVMLAFAAIIAFSEPSRRKHEIQMAEIKSRDGEQVKELNAEYTKLATETREAQASMQADIAAIRSSVESIEQMMRDVG
ncbi:MAG: hypothetical protein P4L93_09885 [Coriobacteriia bacterium]|nr:hypothetical protein [Coriobacteriia bacterium]